MISDSLQPRYIYRQLTCPVARRQLTLSCLGSAPLINLESEMSTEVLSTASKQLGSHLLIVGARYPPWKDDQGKLRQVIEDGLSYLTGSTPAILQKLQ